MESCTKSKSMLGLKVLTMTFFLWITLGVIQEYTGNDLTNMINIVFWFLIAFAIGIPLLMYIFSKPPKIIIVKEKVNKYGKNK